MFFFFFFSPRAQFFMSKLVNGFPKILWKYRMIFHVMLIFKLFRNKKYRPTWILNRKSKKKKNLTCNNSIL